MEDTLRKIIEAEGWQATESTQDGEKIIEIQRFSPSGEDFHATIWCGDGTAQEFKTSLGRYCAEYDVDYETYIWLGSDGHGKKGAPYHIKDIIRSKEWCLNRMRALCRKINNSKINKNEEGD